MIWAQGTPRRRSFKASFLPSLTLWAQAPPQFRLLPFFDLVLSEYTSRDSLAMSTHIRKSFRANRRAFKMSFDTPSRSSLLPIRTNEHKQHQANIPSCTRPYNTWTANPDECRRGRVVAFRNVVWIRLVASPDTPFRPCTRCNKWTFRFQFLRVFTWRRGWTGARGSQRERPNICIKVGRIDGGSDNRAQVSP